MQEGMVLAFRLRANPTKKIDTKSGPDGERRNGRRVELRKEEDQLQWLHRKGSQHGFTLLTTTVNPGVPDVRAAATGKVTGARRSRGSGDEPVVERNLTFGSVLFEGRLRVVDAAALRAALVQGIGSGKAYGFGLLSVAPGR
jgi:CRISPR system Cascade subunit CasE